MKQVLGFKMLNNMIINYVSSFGIYLLVSLLVFSLIFHLNKLEWYLGCRKNFWNAKYFRAGNCCARLCFEEGGRLLLCD